MGNRVIYSSLVAFVGLSGVLISLSFKGEEPFIDLKRFKTQYVFILVIDGPRMSETFGDSTHQFIPNLANVLAPQGVLLKNFRNNGVTHTNPGHTAITTGVYQRLKNNGEELPRNPSMFQYFLKEKGLDSTHAWVIASKGKLNVLGNTKDRRWKDQFNPSLYCGVNGAGMGYAGDNDTWKVGRDILSKYHPKLVLINLLEVDVKGHQNKWDDYLKALRNTDQKALELWNFIQSDSIYKDKTTLFITNDHGRHIEGHKDGFVSHGDNCEGCRSIYLIALGPDCKKNVQLSNAYEQLDISKTIARMLNFDFPVSKGEVMWDLFE
ncbi:MAG: sulfatase [Flavobacteriia bacterium]|jgi:hypothetical protein